MIKRLNTNFAFLKHFRNYLSANIATKAIGFISIPLLTRYLTQQEYGTVNVFLAYVSIFQIILPCNLYAGIGRYYYEKKADIEEFIGTSILATFLLVFLSCLIFYFFKTEIARIISIDEKYIWFVIGGVVNAIILSIYTQILQPEKLSRQLSIVNVVKGYTILLVMGCLLICFNEKLRGYFIAQVGVGFLFSMYMLWDIREKIKFKVVSKHIKYILGYAIPLIPYSLSGFILSHFDRIMINSMIDSSSAGLYSFAYNIGYLSAVVITAIMTALLPYYFEYVNKGLFDKLNKEVKQAYKVFILCVIGLIYFSEEIALILGTENYTSSIKLIPIIIFGYVFFFIANIYLRNIDYQKKTVYMSIILLSSGVLNIVLNYFFIPKYGIIAGAITTVISYFVMMMLAFFISKIIIKFNPISIRSFVSNTFLLIIMIIIYYIINSFSLSFWIMIFFKTVILIIMSYIILKQAKMQKV